MQTYNPTPFKLPTSGSNTAMGSPIELPSGQLVCAVICNYCTVYYSFIAEAEEEMD